MDLELRHVSLQGPIPQRDLHIETDRPVRQALPEEHLVCVSKSTHEFGTDSRCAIGRERLGTGDTNGSKGPHEVELPPLLVPVEVVVDIRFLQAERELFQLGPTRERRFNGSVELHFNFLELRRVRWNDCLAPDIGVSVVGDQRSQTVLSAEDRFLRSNHFLLAAGYLGARLGNSDRRQSADFHLLLVVLESDLGQLYRLAFDFIIPYGIHKIPVFMLNPGDRVHDLLLELAVVQFRVEIDGRRGNFLLLRTCGR